jgi:hypothetical protein
MSPTYVLSKENTFFYKTLNNLQIKCQAIDDGISMWKRLKN